MISIFAAHSYNEHSARLLNMACSFGYDMETAKDLVQQFFLEMIQKKLTDNILNPEGYITTAFKRKLIDQYRSDKKMLARIEPEFIDLAPSPQQVLEKLEDHKVLIDKLATAYKKLPARCRRVIYMKYYLDHSVREISNITGLSEQNIYNNLSKGIKELRKTLDSSANRARFASLLSFIF